MKNKWNEMNTIDKTVNVARIVLILSVITLLVLENFGIIDKAGNYDAPLLGIYMLILSVQEWKDSKGQAIFSICCAVLLFLLFFVLWFGR